MSAPPLGEIIAALVQRAGANIEASGQHVRNENTATALMHEVDRLLAQVKTHPMYLSILTETAAANGDGAALATLVLSITRKQDMLAFISVASRSPHRDVIIADEDNHYFFRDIVANMVKTWTLDEQVKNSIRAWLVAWGDAMASAMFNRLVNDAQCMEAAQPTRPASGFSAAPRSKRNQ